MKKFAILMLAIVTFGGLSVNAHAAVEKAAALAQPAPDFTLTDVDGKDVSLSDYKGKKVVLEWTNHECPYVQKHYDSGNMQKTQKISTEDHDVVWLTIVSSAKDKQGYVTPEEGKKIVEEAKATPTAKLLDVSGKVGHLYGAKTTPHMYIIDEEGTLVYRGAIDDNSSHKVETIDGALNYVTAALDDLKNDRPIAHADTKPYGCGVKY